MIIPKFSGSSHRMEIVLIVRPNRKKPEVADVTESTFFDLPLIPTSESVHTSSALLADLENVVDNFGISLPFYIEAEILRYFMSTSSNDGHL